MRLILFLSLFVLFACPLSGQETVKAILDGDQITFPVTIIRITDEHVVCRRAYTDKDTILYIPSEFVEEIRQEKKVYYPSTDGKGEQNFFRDPLGFVGFGLGFAFPVGAFSGLDQPSNTGKIGMGFSAQATHYFKQPFGIHARAGFMILDAGRPAWQENRIVPPGGYLEQNGVNAWDFSYALLGPAIVFQPGKWILDVDGGILIARAGEPEINRSYWLGGHLAREYSTQRRKGSTGYGFGAQLRRPFRESGTMGLRINYIFSQSTFNSSVFEETAGVITGVDRFSYQQSIATLTIEMTMVFHLPQPKLKERYHRW